MRSLVLALDERNDSPVFLRIARALAEEIRRGRLRAGEMLPGSRTLAETLGVHRNTVLAAYRELVAEGWVESSPARGTFVAAAMPDVAPRRFSAQAPGAIAPKPGFDVPEPEGRFEKLDDLLERARNPPPPVRGTRGPMSLGGGMPDVRLVPAAELVRAMRRVLARRTLDVLSYGDPAGPPRLRRALASMVTATRGIVAREEHVLVTRGSQMALDLVARTLVSPGDVVAVEGLGYRPAWEALRGAGARLVPIPVDGHGVSVDALEALAKKERVRGVYVTPHHQFPTTVTLAPARRIRLLELAQRERMFVLEDDYDHEFHYEGRPVLPLASADASGVVVYVGTLSKVLAPGMRVGFLVAPTPLVERLTALRRVVDRQGDQLLEHVVAELLEEGELGRHVRRAKRVYAARRALLASLLEERFGETLSFALPPGGTALWAKVDKSVAVDAWVARAAELSLVLQPARLFAFDRKSRPFLRIGFAQHDEAETREAVRRMAAALVNARSTGRSGRARAAPRSNP